MLQKIFMNNTVFKIENLLKKELDIIDIKIYDDSHKHQHHKKDTSGGHFRLYLVCDKFKNVSLINRHKMIYEILDTIMKVEIHALSMKLLSSEEI